MFLVIFGVLRLLRPWPRAPIILLDLNLGVDSFAL